MNKELWFRRDDDENCYSLKYHLELAKEEGLEKVELILAKPDSSTEYFFCRAVGEVATIDDNPCGKYCEDYAPKNGKSGMCKHKGRCYLPTESFVFDVKTGRKALPTIP